VVVGLEMFSKDSQDVLDRWAEGRISEEDFVIKYRDNWTIDWSLYRDIFLFARERKIPLIALNVPGEIIRKVRKTGFSSLTEGEVGKLPPGIGCVVDEKYMEFMRRVFAAHRNDDKAFLYFCEAQLLRDKTMAWYLLDYMKKNPGRTAVVITGIAHAWKKGMPAQIQEISGRGSFRVILPEVTGVIAPQSGSEQDADYIILK
jgi:uncharacterized iron-regulated protein